MKNRLLKKSTKSQNVFLASFLKSLKQINSGEIQDFDFKKNLSKNKK